jgi:hypothetical protein
MPHGIQWKLMALARSQTRASYAPNPNNLEKEVQQFQKKHARMFFVLRKRRAKQC